VRLSPAAHAVYLGLVADADFPVGSVILEVLREEGTNLPGPVLALERTEADWVYQVLDTEGRPDPAHAASLELCPRCHAAAPAAPIFGLPRSTPPAADSASAPSPSGAVGVDGPASRSAPAPSAVGAPGSAGAP